MGVVLRLQAPAANINPGVAPLVQVESSKFMVTNLSMATTLVLALESHDYDMETSPIIITPGHVLVHLSAAVDSTTWSSLLCLGHTIKRGLRHHQPPQQHQPLSY